MCHSCPEASSSQRLTVASQQALYLLLPNPWFSPPGAENLFKEEKKKKKSLCHVRKQEEILDLHFPA